MMLIRSTAVRSIPSNRGSTGTESRGKSTCSSVASSPSSSGGEVHTDRATRPKATGRLSRSKKGDVRFFGREDGQAPQGEAPAHLGIGADDVGVGEHQRHPRPRRPDPGAVEPNARPRRPPPVPCRCARPRCCARAPSPATPPAGSPPPPTPARDRRRGPDARAPPSGEPTRHLDRVSIPSSPGPSPATALRGRSIGPCPAARPHREQRTCRRRSSGRGTGRWPTGTPGWRGISALRRPAGAPGRRTLCPWRAPPQPPPSSPQGRRPP